MKLLYVVARAEYFLSHRLELAHDSEFAGFEVAVATTDFSENGHNKLNDIKNFFIRFKRGSINPITEIKTVIDLIKVFKKFRPNIVHNVSLKPALYCAMIARFSGTTSINSINGFGYIFTSNQLKAKLLRPVIRLALKFLLNHSDVHVIVQNSQDYQDCSALLPKCKLYLVAGSGVNVKAFTPTIYHGAFTFTLVARMLWSKGVGEFVEAAQIFKFKNPDANVRFLLVGSPDLENPESVPEETLKNWHDTQIIEWVTHTDKVSDIYAKTSVAVLPSYREGMPKSLLEAMACGLPVITTNARGCDDLVQHGVNGLKAPVKDVQELFAAMEECYQNPGKCIIMGENGRRSALNIYATEVINKEIIKVYKNAR